MATLMDRMVCRDLLNSWPLTRTRLGTRKLNFQNVQNTSLGIERDVRFEPSEVIGVQAPNVKEFIQDVQNQELYNYWMPLGNENLLKGLNNLDEGAGQVRLFGRLAYHWNARKIATTLKGAINDILLAGNPDEDFEPSGGRWIQALGCLHCQLPCRWHGFRNVLGCGDEGAANPQGGDDEHGWCSNSGLFCFA